MAESIDRLSITNGKYRKVGKEGNFHGEDLSLFQLSIRQAEGVLFSLLLRLFPLEDRGAESGRWRN